MLTKVSISWKSAALFPGDPETSSGAKSYFEVLRNFQIRKFSRKDAKESHAKKTEKKSLNTWASLRKTLFALA